MKGSPIWILQELYEKSILKLLSMSLSSRKRITKSFLDDEEDPFSLENSPKRANTNIRDSEGKSKVHAKVKFRDQIRPKMKFIILLVICRMKMVFNPTNIVLPSEWVFFVNFNMTLSKF